MTDFVKWPPIEKIDSWFTKRREIYKKEGNFEEKKIVDNQVESFISILTYFLKESREFSRKKKTLTL
jgi:hypothetical protein